MTALPETVPVSAVAERAAEIRFGSTLAKGIALFFMAIGWTFAMIWRGSVYCALFIQVGFWKGRGLTDEQVMARLNPEPPPEQPVPPRSSKL